jgi:class 3 adenylate cyclase/tetratricopeptide (TPR) repeat protein
MINSVTQWLKQLGLGQYADVFAEQQIDREVLPELTEEDFEKLGIPLGPRKKLLKAIAALQPSSSASRSIPLEGSVAERRQLTVMFCDLVGSTALAEGMDLEEYREVLAAYQTESAKAINRYNGYIARYMGDGLLVYFGYPQAHEDDAERAIRSGLDVVDAIGNLKAGRTIGLQARIGIATGQVVAGDIIGEGASEERAVLGNTPNLAARLQSLAEPGTVVISSSTLRLTGKLFTYEDAGRHELKGFSEPAQAWRVVGEAASKSRFEATRSPEDTVLVGRETECLLLLDRWERAKDAEGQVVLLSGEPGIGKSRLTHALRERVESEPHTLLQYQCSPHHVNSAFHPFIEHIQRTAGVARNDTPETKLGKLETWLSGADQAISDAAPLMAALLSIPVSGRYPPINLSPQRQKEKTIEALTDRFSALARHAPVLLLFEDMHWADPTTLDVMSIVIDAAPGTAMLVVMTHRPEFVSPWQGRGHVTAHSLTRLGKRQVMEIVEGVTGGKPLPDALLGEIVEKTDGVPLFVEELTKAVMEAGFLEDSGDRFTLRGPQPPLSVPSTLQDSLVARLDRLAEVKNVAQVAAAIGREFSYELLAELSPLDDSLLQDALSQLEHAELIYRRGTPPDATYSFKHALVRDAAYDSLLKRHREELHAELAAALEGRFPETASQEPELLAHHYTAAGRAAEAVDYLQRATQRALERSAYPEALAHLDSALDLLKAYPDVERRVQSELEVQVARGGALMATQGYLAVETGQAFARARVLSREVGDPRQSFRVLRGLHGIHFVKAELDTALQVAEECLRMAEESGDSQPSSLAHRLVGQTLCMRGDLAAARGHLEQALALDSGPRSDKVASLVHGGGYRLMAPAFLAQVYWIQGFPDQALALAKDGVTEAEAEYGAFTVTASLFFLCWIHGWRGDYETLNELVERMRRLASEHEISEWVTTGGLFPDWSVLASGETGDAAALARQRLEAVREQSGIMTPFKLGLLAEALAVGGDGAALEVIDEALALTEQGERWSESELVRIKGKVLLAQNGASAEESFHQALHIARQQGARSWELRAATTLARLWCDEGKRKAAHELLAPIYGWFTEGFDTADLKEAKVLLEHLS